MTKYIRVFIAIVMVLGFVLLAKNQSAWADQPAHKTDKSSRAEIGQYLPLQKHDPCEKEKYRNKHRDKCGGGSVVPPKDHIKICEHGKASVGGVAILDINNLRDKGCLTAHTRSADPGLDKLPTGAGIIVSDVIGVTLPPNGGNVKICFAVPPGEQAKIYSSPEASLLPLQTDVKNGIACAEVKTSGNFTLVSQ